MSQPTIARRRPGRPRSTVADAAILAATREVLAEVGWAGLSVEGVAARAGVAKTTIYRRWSSRTDLAVGAVAELLATARVEPASTTAEDVRRATAGVAAALRSPAARAAYLAVVAEATRDDALRAKVDTELVGPTRQLVASGVARAVSRGEAAVNSDVDLIYDVLAGALIHRVLVRGADADDAFLETLSTLVLALTAPGSGATCRDESEVR